jgi:hypothetical protein
VRHGYQKGRGERRGFALLKWTVRHPPHDRVIIVFHQDACALLAPRLKSRQEDMKPIEFGLASAHGRGHGQGEGTAWINHDKAQRDTQKMSPEFYE